MPCYRPDLRSIPYMQIGNGRQDQTADTEREERGILTGWSRLKPESSMLEAANADRHSEHQQRIAQNGANQRGPNNVHQPFGQGKDTNNQLGSIAKGSKEQSANPLPRVFSHLFYGLPDERGQRN